MPMLSAFLRVTSGMTRFEFSRYSAFFNSIQHGFIYLECPAPHIGGTLRAAVSLRSATRRVNSLPREIWVLCSIWRAPEILGGGCCAQVEEIPRNGGGVCDVHRERHRVGVNSRGGGARRGRLHRHGRRSVLHPETDQDRRTAHDDPD